MLWVFGYILAPGYCEKVQCISVSVPLASVDRLRVDVWGVSVYLLVLFVGETMLDVLLFAL